MAGTQVAVTQGVVGTQGGRCSKVAETQRVELYLPREFCHALPRLRLSPSELGFPPSRFCPSAREFCHSPRELSPSPREFRHSSLKFRHSPGRLYHSQRQRKLSLSPPPSFVFPSRLRLSPRKLNLSPCAFRCMRVFYVFWERLSRNFIFFIFL